MATFVEQTIDWTTLHNYNYQLHLRNYTAGVIDFDFSQIPGASRWVGDPTDTLNPNTNLTLSFFVAPAPIEAGSVELVFGPAGNKISVRFWSGQVHEVVASSTDQYINLLSENGWTVTTDTAEMSALSKDSLQIWVDGGGVSDPKVSDIYFSIR